MHQILFSNSHIQFPDTMFLVKYLPVVSNNWLLLAAHFIKSFHKKIKMYFLSAETKYFVCACPRCVDPTELGTLFSSIKSVDNI